MSVQPVSITASMFAEAIKDLPLSNIFAKASEIQNSIAHLHRSNDEMRAFVADSCDTEDDKREIEGYVSENEGIVTSMYERIALLKAEVEGRGQRWIEAANGAGANAANAHEEQTEPSSSSETAALAATAQPVVNGTTEGETHRGETAQESRGSDADREQEGIYL